MIKVTYNGEELTYKRWVFPGGEVGVKFDNATAFTGPGSKNKGFDEFATKASALKSKGQPECKT